MTIETETDIWKYVEKLRMDVIKMKNKNRLVDKSGVHINIIRRFTYGHNISVTTLSKLEYGIRSLRRT
tara:strand:- start:2685 stop:2888 length:204 start_codon:yes stop_codon:yes gene_type:complete